MGEKEQRITWHTAFYDAIRLELLQYQDVLEFDIERQLTREPLRIDMVIIKKKKDITIDKKIAAIFKTWNLIEYKGPDDSLSVADFHKVMAYAHLYCVPPEKGIIGDLTVTFVTSREPRELKNHLRGICRYTLTERWPGITMIESGLMPMQILNRKKLPSGEDLWLRGLDRGLSFDSTAVIIAEAKKVPKEAPIGAFLSMLVQANNHQVQEVLDMRGDAVVRNLFKDVLAKRSDAVVDDIFIEVGAAARWEAKGKAAGKIVTAKTLKELGDPAEKIAHVTGLSFDEIAKL